MTTKEIMQAARGAVEGAQLPRIPTQTEVVASAAKQVSRDLMNTIVECLSRGMAAMALTGVAAVLISLVLAVLGWLTLFPAIGVLWLFGVLK